MALSEADFEKILSGFNNLRMQERQKRLKNPIKLKIPINGTYHSFRLWCFEITHGGGGPLVRSANEFRIQITSGPTSFNDFDHDAKDLLIGYMREKDVLVAFDIRWLEKYTEKKEENPESRPSPSAQVKIDQINAAQKEGIFNFEKETSFGVADIVTFKPKYLPEFLKNNSKFLRWIRK